MSTPAQLHTIDSLSVELDISRRVLVRQLSGLEPDTQDDYGKLSKRWLMARVVRHLYMEDGAVSPQEAKARLDTLRADQVELKIAIEKKELVPVSILERALSKVAEVISSTLYSSPLKLKKRSSRLTARDIEMVRREFARLANEISETRLDLSEA